MPPISLQDDEMLPFITSHEMQEPIFDHVDFLSRLPDLILGQRPSDWLVHNVLLSATPHNVFQGVASTHINAKICVCTN